MKKPAAKKPSPSAVALELLTTHKTIDATAPHLAERISTDADFRLAFAVDFLKRVAPKPPAAQHSRRRAGPHKRPKAIIARDKPSMPTDVQKTGALRAGQQSANQILARKMRGGRRVDEVHVHELRAIGETSASTATSFFTRGYDDAVDSIACTMMANHCVAADPFALVKDVIKPTTIVLIFERAKIKAAEAIRDASAKVANDLLQIGKAEQMSLQ